MSSKFTSNKFFFFDIKKLHLEFFVKKKKKNCKNMKKYK